MLQELFPGPRTRSLQSLIRSPLFSLSSSAGPPKQQVVEYTEKSQDKHESRHIQMVREYGFNPRSKVSVEDGAVLPRKFEPFPADMYGKPLEEIDNFIYEEVSPTGSLIIYPVLDRFVNHELQITSIKSGLLLLLFLYF